MDGMGTFFVGLMVVGLGLTVKVARDGIVEMQELSTLITDCSAETVVANEKTEKAKAETTDLESTVVQLREEVKVLEAKEKEILSNVKQKRDAEETKVKTSFKVDLQ